MYALAKPGDGVGRTRAAGHETRRHAAGRAGVAVGRVHGALLVPRQDRADLLGVVEGVEDRQRHAARDSRRACRRPRASRQRTSASCAGHAFAHESTAPLSALETSFA